MERIFVDISDEAYEKLESLCKHEKNEKVRNSKAMQIIKDGKVVLDGDLLGILK